MHASCQGGQSLAGQGLQQIPQCTIRVPGGVPQPGMRHEVVLCTFVVHWRGATLPRPGMVCACVVDSGLPRSHTGAAMTTPRILDEIGAKLSELAANSPARDIEKNLKAVAASAFGKLDLVTREEFDVQREVLAHARQRLAELENRVAALEAELAGRDRS